MRSLRTCWWFAPGLIAAAAMVACHRPTVWPWSGPRVYLIGGTPQERSDGLIRVRDELLQREINAEVYSPDDWLRVVVDIDARPDEEAIVVGHGHGGFLATQVARHYAQPHKFKYIRHVIVLDAFNKDWPWAERDRHRPSPIPIGHSARRVHNFAQNDENSDVFGATLVSTRDSNLADEHPYYWYDHYWYRRPLTGQRRVSEVSAAHVTHETIDNLQELTDRIVTLCRRSALTPFHYTPVRHHPYAGQADEAAPKPPEKPRHG